MRHLLTVLFTLCFTAAYAENSNSNTSQNESAGDTHYVYKLRTNKVKTEHLNTTFAEAADISVKATFSGNWSYPDDAGIDYYLNTRRNRLSITYRGEDPHIQDRAKAKAKALNKRLGLRQPNPRPAGSSDG